VRATNTAGNSEWSQTWSFTTVSEEGTLVGHWKMDEASGTTVADASMYGNHAQMTGAAERVPGVHGQALRFSGNNQYAAAPDHPSLNIAGAITLAAWVRPENTDTQYLIRKALVNVTDGYELTMTKGTVFFRFNQASEGVDAFRLNSTGFTHPSDGSWVHLAATYDGQTARLYINGAENSSVTFTSPPPIGTNSLPLVIGALNDGTRGLRGAVDDVRIYNTALEPADVLQLAAMPPPPAPLLKAPGDLSSSAPIAPALEWNPATGAETYSVHVSEDPGFTDTAFEQEGITENTVLVPGLDLTTQYFWRVRATHTAGTSEWSKTSSIPTVSEAGCL